MLPEKPAPINYKTIPKEFREELVGRYLCGEKPHHICRRTGITYSVFYRIIKEEAPDIIGQIDAELEGLDLPAAILASLRSKMDVMAAIEGVFVDLAEGKEPVADKRLVDYVLSQPIDRLVDGLRGIDAAVIRTAACLTRIQANIGETIAGNVLEDSSNPNQEPIPGAIPYNGHQLVPYVDPAWDKTGVPVDVQMSDAELILANPTTLKDVIDYAFNQPTEPKVP